MSDIPSRDALIEAAIRELSESLGGASLRYEMTNETMLLVDGELVSTSFTSETGLVVIGESKGTDTDTGTNR
jgi:hypothetical protein